MIRKLVTDHMIIPAGQPSHGRYFDLDAKLLIRADPEKVRTILTAPISNEEKVDLIILYIESLCSDELMTPLSDRLSALENQSWLQNAYNALTGYLGWIK